MSVNILIEIILSVVQSIHKTITTFSKAIGFINLRPTKVIFEKSLCKKVAHLVMLSSVGTSVFSMNFARVMKKATLTNGSFKFSSEDSVKAILARYPADQKRAAVIPLLHLAQEQNGYLTRGVLNEISQITGTPLGRIHETATFYSMFRFSPPNKHIVEVCRGLTCYLKGSDGVKKAIEEACNGSFKEGGSKDGKFTLEEVECLGACANAPVMIVDGVYYQDLTSKTAKKIIENLKNGKSIQEFSALKTPPAKSCMCKQ